MPEYVGEVVDPSLGVSLSVEASASLMQVLLTLAATAAGWLASMLSNSF